MIDGPVTLWSSTRASPFTTATSPHLSAFVGGFPRRSTAAVARDAPKESQFVHNPAKKRQGRESHRVTSHMHCSLRSDCEDLVVTSRARDLSLGQFLWSISDATSAVSFCALGRAHAASIRACGLQAVVRLLHVPPSSSQETRPASAARLTS